MSRSKSAKHSNPIFEKTVMSSSQKSKRQAAVLVATGLVAAATYLGAPYPREWWLQHVPTAAILLALGVTVFRPGWSWLSLGCMVLFLALHIIGARWIYSFVPYDRWSEALFGFSLSESMGWKRNHYDRLVHLASGMLIVPPASEWLQRFGGMRPLGAAVMGISVALAIGAVYEVLEWQIAIVFSPAAAEAYNGQQGDVWDPQKDLALAGLGAIVSAGLMFRTRF